MLRNIAALAVGLMLAACVGPPSDVEVIDNPATTPVLVDPSEAAREVSAIRAEAGLPPVTVNATLTAIAQDYADALAAAGTVSHTLRGSLPSRLAAGGYAFFDAGENLGGGYVSLDDALTRWMASPGHRSVLLASPVTEIGIATAFNRDSPFRNFWVLLLARPR